MKQEQDSLSSVGDRIKQKTPPFFKKLRTIGLVVAAIGTSLVMAPVALPVLVTTIGGYLIVGGTVLSTVSQTAVESKD
ncbi:MAG: hypothetical protein EBU01_11240 [Crocinitomicaceae bacterium]|nr:hypothetical protein [Crocinitomicaceae bacterium]NCA22038.1 hypothetical protein [Crocinitomicaceae bacterium]